MRSFQSKLPEFNARGIRIAAVSVDTPEESEHLRKVAGYSFLILCDDHDELIRRWDLVHPKMGPDGKDIARPAEFILDSSGKVRWVKLTDDILIRARPEEVLREIDSLNLAHASSDGAQLLGQRVTRCELDCVGPLGKRSLAQVKE